MPEVAVDDVTHLCASISACAPRKVLRNEPARIALDSELKAGLSTWPLATGNCSIFFKVELTPLEIPFTVVWLKRSTGMLQGVNLQGRFRSGSKSQRRVITERTKSEKNITTIQSVLSLLLNPKTLHCLMPLSQQLTVVAYPLQKRDRGTSCMARCKILPRNLDPCREALTQSNNEKSGIECHSRASFTFLH